MNDDELSRLVRTQATRHAASDGLRAAVRTQLALQAARHDAAPRPWSMSQRWPGLVAAFAAGAALSLALVLGLPPLLPGSDRAAERVAAHVQALQRGPLIEVASSDRHTVKPWFQGRLDYAPPVPDLASEGFPLLGGRVDQLDGAPVATLVYGARQHMLSVTVWPARDPQAPQRAQHRGFQAMHWAEGGMQVWVVSDQDAAEIERFGHAWRAQAAALNGGH